MNLKRLFSAAPEGAAALFFIQIFATLGFAVSRGPKNPLLQRLPSLSQTHIYRLWSRRNTIYDYSQFGFAKLQISRYCDSRRDNSSTRCHSHARSADACRCDYVIKRAAILDASAL